MTDPHPLRLDRSRYHSSVHGEFQSTTHYWQDGLPFDAVGHLVVGECDAEMLAKADAKAPKATPAATATAPFFHMPLGDPPLADGDVNLELWAKGEARYLPGKVFAAIRERYNKSVTTFADAIEFLVNDVKLIPREQASTKLLAMGGAAPAKEEA
jgi:hypothetical protein